MSNFIPIELKPRCPGLCAVHCYNNIAERKLKVAVEALQSCRDALTVKERGAPESICNAAADMACKLADKAFREIEGEK